MRVCQSGAQPLCAGRVDRAQLERAGLLLRPFCLRRLKEDVEKSLPPRVWSSKGSPTGLQRV